MVSEQEQRVSRSLRLVLADLPDAASIPDSEQYRELLSGLEHFLTSVLGEIYPEWGGTLALWRQLCFDGICPILARKTGDGEVEIFGPCFTLPYRIMPLHLNLQIAPAVDEVSWLECRLGENGDRKRLHTSHESLDKMSKRLYLLDGKADQIEWVYKVTFGERRS